MTAIMIHKSPTLFEKSDRMRGNEICYSTNILQINFNCWFLTQLSIPGDGSKLWNVFDHIKASLNLSEQKGLYLKIPALEKQKEGIMSIMMKKAF